MTQHGGERFHIHAVLQRQRRECMIKLLHAADLHLDSPFRGLSAEKAQTRREEQRGLLDKGAALAEERGVDVVLIAGDLFDGDGVYYETTRMLA